ncbi:branched-chain amino acid ABC transporter permease [Pusillimonas sp.]|uniref:branched-chain amino acid ABC transporter permease n=1 Tax=Pusillimonas sp. TaxID=3040095 RepID=UPI0037C5D4B2
MSKKLNAPAFFTPIALISILALVVALTYLLGGERQHITVTEMLVRMIAVVGIYLFVGNSGLLSFGHVGFMCLGAYTAAWVTLDPMWKRMMLSALPDVLRNHAYGFEISLVLAAVLCMVLALMLGAVIMRMSGLASTITTFGFLVVLNSVFPNWSSVRAGTSWISGIPTFVTPFWALLAVAVCIVLAWIYQRSRYGLMLRATRESVPAAQACAVSIVKMRLLSFVLSAGMCGVAGAMYAHFVGFLSPDALYLDATFILLAMLIIGGSRSLTGAVAGTVAVSLLIEALRLAEGGLQVGATTLALPGGVQPLGLAAFLAVVLLLRPDGLTKGRELSGRRAGSRSHSAARAEAAAN